MDKNQNGEQPGAVRFGLLKATAKVPQGAMIPAWHGVWAFDHASEEASTMLMPFNLLAVLAFGVVKFFKLGGLRVAADPRQAFVDGMNQGHELAVEELPDEMRNMREQMLGNLSVLDALIQRARRAITIGKVATNLTEQLREYKAADDATPAQMTTMLNAIGIDFAGKIATANSDFDALVLDAAAAKQRMTANDAAAAPDAPAG